jgi:glycosyltransferase involved in cell wall biosynthesis
VKSLSGFYNSILMKILHIFSDWKWTGPSEPILNLCSSLIKSGQVVHLACSQMPDDSGRSLPGKAQELGIKTLLLSSLPKYFPFLAMRRNIKKLAEYIDSEHGFDIVHCHSSIDHFYAYRVRCYYKNIVIIRTNHKGYPLEITLANKFLLKYATNGYITLSKNFAEVDRTNFSLAPERMTVIGGAVDAKPQIKSNNDLRIKLGLKEGDIVVGVVARVQRHRRFDIIIEAMRLVVKDMLQVKLLIIGRGTHYDELVTEPVKRLKLENNIIFAGYRKDDYLDIINMLDFGIYLVPGSDGSCRAALELMSLGKPLIVARRGVLPEIVDNDRTGLVIDDTSDNLKQAILKLAKNNELIRRFSEQARLKMMREFSPEISVKAAIDFYHKVTNFIW